VRKHRLTAHKQAGVKFRELLESESQSAAKPLSEEGSETTSAKLRRDSPLDCYTMGSPEPRSFSRGKRGIAGTLVFTVFDRDALIQAVKTDVTRIGSNTNNAATNTAVTPMTIDEWDQVMSGQVKDLTAEERTLAITQDNVAPRYADELPPFDVTISFANEYGQKAVLVIYGLEVLNEGTGFSIDSVTTEKACTFVARSVDYMRPVEADGSIATEG
jgi:hypothetical protein